MPSASKGCIWQPCESNLQTPKNANAKDVFVAVQQATRLATVGTQLQRDKKNAEVGGSHHFADASHQLLAAKGHVHCQAGGCEWRSKNSNTATVHLRSDIFSSEI